MSTLANREQLRRYLLGNLSEEDQQKIEQTYFAADDQFAELLDVEDELIGTFLQKGLNARERNLFQNHFLATERGRQKLALTAALQKATAPAARPPTALAVRRGPTFLAIAAALILLVIGAALLRQLITIQEQVTHLQNQQLGHRRSINVLTSELQRLRQRLAAAQQAGAVFSFALTPGLERSSAARAPLILPREATAAELWLILTADQYGAYTASLQSVEGSEVWVARSLKPRAVDARKAVPFRIPADHLRPGTYVIALSGEKGDGSLETVEDFSFTVRRP